MDANGDGYIVETEAEAFVNPEALVCSINDLSSLDITALSSLRIQYCGDTHLTSLDLSNNAFLEELNCSKNLLNSLDVSNNPMMTELFCNGNKLTSLDVSQNSFLKTLSITNMPELLTICVWITPFPPAGVTVHREGSPNAYFTTDCG